MSLRYSKWHWVAIPIAAAMVVGALLGSLLALTQNLPQVEALATYEPSAVTTILSDDGTPISSLFVERRIPVPLREIPKDLIEAIIAVEDSRFYQHFGLDIKGIARAVWKDVTTLRMAEGGSTLTQQLAKVLFLTPEKTITRKLKEAILAINIERRYSKDEILTMYLNQIYLGEGAYGVEAAARTYFGKGVRELDLAECAMIAGLPRSPTLYSPLNHPKKAAARMRVVLLRLLNEGYINDETYRLTVEEGVTLRPSAAPEDPAPYFTEIVRRNLESRISANLIYRGGLVIESTLNLDMQRDAENAVKKGLESYAKRHPEGGTEPVQAAMVALDPSTGDIKAMVGGRDFTQSPFNRATQAKRQPGSSFKPVLYAAALSSGFTPSDILNDSPMEISIKGQSAPWVPRNYSKQYHGPVTLRTALEKSLNAASVDLLLRLGYQPVIDTARRLGISADLKPYPSMALGTFDVSLLQMVSAFGVFDNNGILASPHLVKRVKDREGSVIWEAPSHLSDVLSPQVSYQMTNLLEGVNRYGTGRRSRAMGRPSGGKTGTTDGYHDAWFIGYVPGLTAGAWVGFDHSKDLGYGETGARAALPIWMNFMENALKDVPPTPFPVPDGIDLVEVDPVSGLLAGPACPHTIVEAFIPGTAPTRQCGQDE
ncbi:MAG TPA: PBP1A family penicillin-binding protein [Proteobacteria bacterium]|nr:penicillin-binding protein 2D [bacterium BMS3Abin14]HDL53211.1 PBP1A family penicillin-binding protein [Pseudomonadota bacterium]